MSLVILPAEKHPCFDIVLPWGETSAGGESVKATARERRKEEIRDDTTPFTNLDLTEQEAIRHK